MVATPAPGPWVERWLSRPRFDVYLNACVGDRDRALRLYQWNAQLSAAWMHDLGHLEVAIRNAYDEAITSTRPGASAHWLDDPVGPVRATLLRTRRNRRIDINRRPRELAEEARRRCGPSAPPGKVIAELGFGFWRYLTSSAHEKILWVPHLYRAFPAGTNRVDVDRLVGDLHELRNRAAHLEPVLAIPHSDRVADLLRLAELLMPELANYIRATTQVPNLIARRP